MTEDFDCKYVHHFNTSIEQCNFVVNNSNCQDASGFLNYVTVLYCDFQDQEVLGLCLFGLWLAFLFIGLAVSADDFFCPNLHTISSTLRLSHNIAGITIMALGNGAPDIFSSFASVSQSRPELLLGELFGAGVFVTTVVAGSICISKPFKLMERPFLRDVVFYLFAGFWAFFIFYRGEIRLSDSIGFLVMYIVYLLVVIIGRFLHQNLRRRRLAEALLHHEDDEEESTDPTFNVFVPPSNNIPPISEPVVVEEGEVEEGELDEIGHLFLTREPEINLDNIEEIAIATTSGQESIGWRKLARAITPRRLLSSQTKWYSKLWEVFKLPYVIVFTLTIPIFEVEEDDDDHNSSNDTNNNSTDNNWTQYLHVIQFILAPQFVAFTVGFGLRDLVVDPGDRFRIWEIVLVGSLIMTIALLCSTRPDRPPSWRPLFSFLGFGVAVVWIYAIANEIVALLKVFGVALGFSDAILGLTLLAWGNSISDLVADVAVARRGFPRMGFSASFGGPLFNLLLGIGLPFTVVLLREGSLPVQVQFNPMVMVLSASLAAALLASFILLPLAKFQAGKCHGIFLILLYVVLLSAAVTVEVLYGGVAVLQAYYAT